MEIDAEYIKANFDLQLPVEGEITSPYGKREPTDIITENHQGIGHRSSNRNNHCSC